MTCTKLKTKFDSYSSFRITLHGKGGSTVRLSFCQEVRYACTVRCLNLRAKRTKRIVPIGRVRFIGNLRPSMKIGATMYIQLKIHDITLSYLCPDSIYFSLRLLHDVFLSNHYSLSICRYNCIMLSQLTSIANCDIINYCQQMLGLSGHVIFEKFGQKKCNTLAVYAVVKKSQPFAHLI